MNYNLLRSLFFLPSHKEKYLLKIKELDADAIIFDLEDAVPLDEKEKAREMLVTYLAKNASSMNKCIIVRINSLESSELLNDLDKLNLYDIDCLMLTKIYNCEDIFFYGRLLEQLELKSNVEIGKTKFLPLIETCESVEVLNEIIQASSRVIGVAFGGEDFLNDLGGSHGEEFKTFDYVRSKIAISAKANRIVAIDTPYLNIYDTEGYKQYCKVSRSLGMGGSLLIHPSQIDIANNAFSPLLDEIKQAERIVAAVNDSKAKGLSVTLLDGKLVGPPMMKKAFKLLEVKKELEKKRN